MLGRVLGGDQHGGERLPGSQRQFHNSVFVSTSRSTSGRWGKGFGLGNRWACARLSSLAACWRAFALAGHRSSRTTSEVLPLSNFNSCADIPRTCAIASMLNPSESTRTDVEPKVSVVVPLYNKVDSVLRALASLQRQTFQDFEVVVIDDGSTDGSAQIVKAQADRRLRLIAQSNAGPGPARNRGISESRGRFVTFLDADDEFLPEFLGACVKVLEAHPQVAVAVTGYYEGEAQVSREDFFRLFRNATGVWRLPVDVTPHGLKLAADWLGTGKFMCRREALDQVAGFYEKPHCTYSEDTYLNVKLLLSFWFCIQPTPLTWIHTEDSEIGVGATVIKPPSPLVLAPEPIRRNCPPPYRQALERGLGLWALQSARRCLARDDASTALGLLREFPVGREFGQTYWRTRAAAQFPRLKKIWTVLKRGA